MSRLGFLISSPTGLMSPIPLIVGQTANIKPLQYSPNTGATNLDIMIPLEIHLDLPGTKVIMLPQVYYLSDDFCLGCPGAV